MRVNYLGFTAVFQLPRLNVMVSSCLGIQIHNKPLAVSALKRLVSKLNVVNDKLSAAKNSLETPAGNKRASFLSCYISLDELTFC